MLAFIKGKLAYMEQNTVAVDVNGVGYEVQVSMNTIVRLPKLGGDLMLYTYMSVREDGISLMGFYSIEEKNMFLKLTSVSGIGPKGALTILSGIDLAGLMLAIVSSDVKTLSRIKGVGKKTAERIILELKEKLKEFENDLDDDIPMMETSSQNQDIKDAISALCTLGISRSEAQNAVMKSSPNCKSLEELITKALKFFG